MSRGKTQARKVAMQAMYQWSINKTSFADLVQQFTGYETWKKADKSWFAVLVQGVPNNIIEINNSLEAVVDRPLDKIDLVELSILRLGAYELLYHIEIPYKVILNEYINLSKVFGSSQSYRYINATLDKIAQNIRSVEISG